MVKVTRTFGIWLVEYDLDTNLIEIRDSTYQYVSIDDISLLEIVVWILGHANNNRIDTLPASIKERFVW